MDSERYTHRVGSVNHGLTAMIKLVDELVKELEAHEALIGRLEARIIELERKGSQDMTVVDLYCRNQVDRLEERVADLELKAERPKGYSMTDLGNMVDEISKEGLLDDYINERISDHPDTLGEERVQEIARDEAQEVLSNASFDITVS